MARQYLTRPGIPGRVQAAGSSERLPPLGGRSFEAAQAEYVGVVYLAFANALKRMFGRGYDLLGPMPSFKELGPAKFRAAMIRRLKQLEALYPRT